MRKNHSSNHSSRGLQLRVVKNNYKIKRPASTLCTKCTEYRLIKNNEVIRLVYTVRLGRKAGHLNSDLTSTPPHHSSRKSSRYKNVIKILYAFNSFL